MTSPDWLIERGIGETRMVRIVAGEIVAARVLLDGPVPAGSVIAARLARGGVPGVAEADGTEYLLPRGAAGASEGAAIRIEVTREAIPGTEPWKRPLARVTDAPPQPASLAGEVLAFPGSNDRLEEAGWSDLLDEARGGVVRFAGGELRIAPTPAMTLIDVDGAMPAAELALAAAAAAARAIVRHGIGGSIGIDFPTVAGRQARQRIGELVDANLPGPFERTAVNGFGFLQIIRPRRHASLFELAADRGAFEARALLRRVALDRPGAKRLVAHPAVIAVLEGQPAWLDTLAGQVGGAIGLRADAALAMAAAYAEPV